MTGKHDVEGSYGSTYAKTRTLTAQEYLRNILQIFMADVI